MSEQQRAHFANNNNNTQNPEDVLPPHRREIADDLFKAFDLDGNGAVSLGELNQVLESVAQRRKAGKEGAPVDANLERQRKKWMVALQSQIRQAHEQVKRRQSAASFSLNKSGSTVGNVHFMAADVAKGDGDPSLDPDAFAEFIRVFGGKYDEDDFNLFASELRAAVEDAYENTFGSRKKKLIWELFQLMDVNHDALIDMKELQLLLSIESKKDKKSIAKWKAILHQRQTDRRRTSMREADTAATASGRKESFSSSSNSPNSQKERKMSRFAAGDDGIITIQDEDVTGHDSDDEHGGNNEQQEPPMTLKDFQEFLSDFYGNDNDRIEATCTQLREIIVSANRRYLSEMKVDEIMNSIVEDLIRERPHDVLDGIIRSAQRLRRLGSFPTKIYRSWSIANHPFAGSVNTGVGASASSNNLAEQAQ